MGIGNALSTLFTSVVRKPEQAASLPNVRPAADLPTSQNPLAGGFPQWVDPVTAELDRNAYIYIRRTHATAYPIEKLGRMLAAREVQVVSNNADFAEIIQTRCIDKIAGISEAIRWLTWALVEGVSFVYLDGRYVSDWYVPRMVGGGRRKERAGGVMLWDGGDNIVSKQQLVGAGIYPESASDPASYPRHEWMVWRPGGGSNPEGDTDLAYRLYRLAQMAQDAEKQRSLYLERYGTPFAVIKSQLEGLGEDEATQALSAAARKAAMLKRGVTMSLSSDEALSFVNPDGSAWMLLVEATREIEKAAHQEVLLNATTSAPQSVGPDQRGSGDVHKSEEELAVEAAALSMADTALYDLQRNIETNNAERLREAARETSSNKHLIRIPEWHLVLAPSKAERDIDKARTLDLYAAGVPVKASDLYAAFGAEVPEGTEAVLKKEQASPFAGFGGFGNDRAQLSANVTPEEIAVEAAADPSGPIVVPEQEPPIAPQQVSPTPTPEPLKAPAPEPVRLEERSMLEELDEALADEMQAEMNKAFFAIAEQVERGKSSPKLPESTLMMLAKANLLAEVAGRAEAQGELEAHHSRQDRDVMLSEHAARKIRLSRWITIGAGEDEEGNRTGGRRVQISDEGVIEKGLSKGAQGKTLSEAFSDTEATFGSKGGGGGQQPPAQEAPKQRTLDDVRAEIDSVTERMKELRSRSRTLSKRVDKYEESLLEEEDASERSIMESYQAELDEVDDELLDLEDKRNDLRAEQKNLRKAEKRRAKQSDATGKAPTTSSSISEDERSFLERKRARLLDDLDFSTPPAESKRMVDEINDIDRRLGLSSSINMIHLANDSAAPRDGASEAGPPGMSGGRLSDSTPNVVRSILKQREGQQEALDALAEKALSDESLEEKARSAAAALAVDSAFASGRQMTIDERQAVAKSGAPYTPPAKSKPGQRDEIMQSVLDVASKTKKADLAETLKTLGVPTLSGMTKGDMVKRLRSTIANMVESAGTYIDLNAGGDYIHLANVWRTIGAQGGKGGTPVQIDTESGEITKGPERLKGLDASDLATPKVSEEKSTFSKALDIVNSVGFDLATGAIDLAGNALTGAAKLAWRAISSDEVWAVVTDTPLIAAPFRIAEIGRRIFMRIFATEGTYEETLPKWFGLVAEDEDRGPIFNASRAERVHLANQVESAADAFRLAQDSLEAADVPSEWARLIAPVAVLEMGKTQQALTADSLRALSAEVILAAEGDMPDDPAEFVREFVADRDSGDDGPDATPIGQASRAAAEEGE